LKMVIFHVMLSYQRLYCNHSISWSKIICTLIRISIAKYWSKNIPPSVCYDFPYVSYKTGVGKCSILGILNIAFRHLEMKYQLFCWVMLNFRTFTNKNIYETILIYMVWDLKSSQLTPVRKKNITVTWGDGKKNAPPVDPRSRDAAVGEAQPGQQRPGFRENLHRKPMVFTIKFIKLIWVSSKFSHHPIYDSIFNTSGYNNNSHSHNMDVTGKYSMDLYGSTWK